MGQPLIRSYRADGTVRAIWADGTASADRSAGRAPVRASRIEPIVEGRHRHLFHIDFSPLAAETGRDDYAVCLVRPFASYDEARRVEVDWLVENYIRGVDVADIPSRAIQPPAVRNQGDQQNIVADLFHDGGRPGSPQRDVFRAEYQNTPDTSTIEAERYKILDWLKNDAEKRRWLTRLFRERRVPQSAGPGPLDALITHGAATASGSYVRASRLLDEIMEAIESSVGVPIRGGTSKTPRLNEDAIRVLAGGNGEIDIPLNAFARPGLVTPGSSFFEAASNERTARD